MEYEFTTGAPITEQEALEQITALGLHGLAFDDVHEEDETLHWHEFAGVTWVISGTGRSPTSTAMSLRPGRDAACRRPLDGFTAPLRVHGPGW